VALEPRVTAAFFTRSMFRICAFLGRHFPFVHTHTHSQVLWVPEVLKCWPAVLYYAGSIMERQPVHVHTCKRELCVYSTSYIK